MVDHGATTIWERWDGWTAGRGFASPWMNSVNHYSLGSVGEWLYRFLLGIDQEPGTAGFAGCRSGRTPAGRWTGPAAPTHPSGARSGPLETGPRPVHVLGGAAAQRHGHIRVPSRDAAEVRDATGRLPSALANYPGAEFSGPAMNDPDNS